MYAGQVAHPVSGTVFIVKPPPPQRLSGRIIKAESAAAMKELHISQTQHTHKHQGKMLLFLISHRPHGNGSGNVGGPFIILSAGINEVQPPGLQRDAALRCGGVMAHGSMCPICGYGCKAQANASLLVHAQLPKIIRHADFVHGNTPRILLQPVNKLGHCHAVLDVGPLFILYLHIIFNRLHGSSGIYPVDHLIGPVNQAVYSIVDTAFLQQDFLVFKPLHHVVYPVIRHHCDACPFQILPHAYALFILQIRISFSFQHTAVDKQIQLVHGHQSVRQHHGIIQNVIASDI